MFKVGNTNRHARVFTDLQGGITGRITAPNQNAFAALGNEGLYSCERFRAVAAFCSDNLGIGITKFLGCLKEAELYNTVYRMVHNHHTDRYGYFGGIVFSASTGSAAAFALTTD